MERCSDQNWIEICEQQVRLASAIIKRGKRLSREKALETHRGIITCRDALDDMDCLLNRSPQLQEKKGKV